MRIPSKKDTELGAETQKIEQHFYWDTHGQTNVGFGEQVGEAYKAIDADERGVGTFGDLKAAADAVSTTCKAAK